MDTIDIKYVVYVFGLLCFLINVWSSGEASWEKKLREIKLRHAQEGRQRRLAEACEPSEGRDEDERGGQITTEMENMESITVNIGSRELLVRTLQAMGCPVRTEGDRVLFQFQGGHFQAFANDVNNYVSVGYLYWESCPVADTDRMELFKSVINNLNMRQNDTVFFTINEERGEMWVHSGKKFLFISQIPLLQEYLSAELTSFFHTRHEFVVEIARRTAEG